MYTKQRSKVFNLFFFAFVLGNTFGCTQKCPKQLAFPETNLPRCIQVQNGDLNIGEGCIADISANKPENDTGLNVESNQEYKFIAQDGQVWYDASRLNRPICGEQGSWIMNLQSCKKKSKDSLWFSLIAEIKDKPYDLCHKESSTTNIGSFVTTSFGRLLLYANDAVGYYGNNCGDIRVEVYRQK